MDISVMLLFILVLVDGMAIIIYVNIDNSCKFKEKILFLSFFFNLCTIGIIVSCIYRFTKDNKAIESATAIEASLKTEATHLINENSVIAIGIACCFILGIWVLCYVLSEKYAANLKDKNNLNFTK
jgi:hypothetical protein